MQKTDQERARMKERRAERIAMGKADPSIIPHGKPGTRSNWGCHCQPCRDADCERARSTRSRKKQNAQVATTYAFSMRPISPA